MVTLIAGTLLDRDLVAHVALHGHGPDIEELVLLPGHSLHGHAIRHERERRVKETALPVWYSTRRAKRHCVVITAEIHAGDPGVVVLLEERVVGIHALGLIRRRLRLTRSLR